MRFMPMDINQTIGEMGNEKMEAMKRIKDELTDIHNNPIQNINVNSIDEDNLFEWQCSLNGPKDTPYSDGVFFLKIKFPDDFPNKAPEVKFTTPIYNLNVNPINGTNQGGAPLGSVFIPSLNFWKYDSKIKQILLDIYALFYQQDTQSPFGFSRVEELNSNRDLFEKKIRYFTKKFASPNIVNKEYKEGWDFFY